MIKKLVPIDSVDEVVPIINAGATELFCGIITSNGCLNAYSNIPKANLKGFDELKKVLEISHSYEVPVYLTRNLRRMDNNDLNNAFKEIEKAVSLGIDGIIVADLRLLDKVKKANLPLKVISSSLMPSFNSEAVRLYMDLGISRIIRNFSKTVWQK